ncbi:MAG: sugar transferase [Blautia sp.]|nr:sugar transferase [Blautia sp.]
MGSMSIVGTRPPTLDEVANYQPHHHARLAVKPGITGIWQISGRSNITDFEEVVKMDLQYINEWSFLLDLKIIMKTIAVVFKREGSM